MAKRFHPLVNVVTTATLQGPHPLTAREQALEFDFVDPLVDGIPSLRDSRYMKTPERRLLASVLEDAIVLASRMRLIHPRDLRRPKYQPVVDAVAWIRGARVRPGALSFAFVCDHLGIDGRQIVEWLAKTDVIHRRRNQVAYRTNVVKFTAFRKGRRRRAAG